MGDSFGIKQLPYLLAKFLFPMLRMAGWADLDEETLDTKAAPYKIALRSHWRAMVVSHVLSEHEILAEEQQRSLIKVKWDDRAMMLAQDQCMRDVLRLNRSATRTGVMAFVRATCSRSGAFSRDWADLRGLCLQWIGRNILSVYDFVWDVEGMFIEMPDGNVLEDAIAGEVDIHRVKFFYHEKRYVYPMAFTADMSEVARRCATWMANYLWRRGLYEVQYSGMTEQERAACLEHRTSTGRYMGTRVACRVEPK